MILCNYATSCLKEECGLVVEFVRGCEIVKVFIAMLVSMYRYIFNIFKNNIYFNLMYSYIV